MKEGIQQLKTHENPRSLTTLVDFVLEDDSQQLPFQGKTHILFHINNVTIKGCPFLHHFLNVLNNPLFIESTSIKAHAIPFLPNHTNASTKTKLTSRFLKVSPFHLLYKLRNMHFKGEKYISESKVGEYWLKSLYLCHETRRDD